MTYRKRQEKTQAADSHTTGTVHSAVFMGGMTKKTRNVQDFHETKLIFYKEVRAEEG